MPELRQLLHHVQHFLDHLGVERRGRLVEEHDARLHRQRPRDRDALLLAARKLAGVFAGLFLDADALEQLAARAPRPLCCVFLRTHIGASVMFCSTVRCGNRLNCWKTMPVSRRIASMLRMSLVSSMPSTMISPCWCSSSRLIVRMKVDLPEPDGPKTTTTSPRRTVALNAVEHMEIAVPFMNIAADDDVVAELRLASTACVRSDAVVDAR